VPLCPTYIPHGLTLDRTRGTENRPLNKKRQNKRKRGQTCSDLGSNPRCQCGLLIPGYYRDRLNIYFHVSVHLVLYPHTIHSFSYCRNVLMFILMLARTEEFHLQDNRMNKLCKLCQVSASYLDKDACSLHVQTNETRLLLCDKDRRRTRVECIIEFRVHSSPKRVFWYIASVIGRHSTRVRQ
jgi:hypothetical protein